MALHHGAEVLESIELNLANAFPCNTDLHPDLLQSLASVTMQSEAPFDHGTLLVAELTDPMIDDIVNGVFLCTPRRFSISFGPQPVHGPAAILVSHSRTQGNALVQSHQAFYTGNVPIEMFGNLGSGRVPFLLLAQAARSAQAGVDVLDDVDRQANRAVPGS